MLRLFRPAKSFVTLRTLKVAHFSPSLSAAHRIRGVFVSQHRGFSAPAVSILSDSSPSSSMASIDRSLYVLPRDTPVCVLDCVKAFDALTDTEKKYAHYISKASFDGGLATFLQVSPEASGILITFYRLFAAESIDSLKAKAKSVGLTDDDFTDLLVYAAGFYNNSGNYKGFGDSKIVPSIPREKLEKLIKESAAAKKYQDFVRVFETVVGRMYSLEANETLLGFYPNAVTTYHSENVTKEDVEFVDGFLKSKQIEAWNTRLFKDFEKRDGKTVYRIVNASFEQGICKEEEFNGAIFVIQRGDYNLLMKRTADALQKATSFVANDTQCAMLKKYIEHFNTGELNTHKDGSRFWIKDKNPSIESYIGFIENYRDPAGTRSEFEGFAAAVNKETSKKFQTLVDNAEAILERMPWGKAYEKDKFLKPDFTALDVISFSGSGIPAGINIPNYDEIRQDEGFKNVSLSNVISAMPKQKMNFLDSQDEDLMFKFHKDSFEVQVGLHELLGHGSGKLFQKNTDGSFNFSPDTKNILTGEKIASWYQPGETWSSKFGGLSNAYEECRAEAVGYFLCCDADILKIFGYEGSIADDVKYVNWLSEIRAGLMAIEFYNPDLKKWGQAHCYARYVLTKVCLEAGQGFITITDVTGEDGKPDLSFKLDRTKIDSVGKPAIREFLKKLQHYKSTADFEGGSKMFTDYGKVTEKELAWRDICVARRKPRRLFVQMNTQVSANGVKLVEYPATVEGIVKSFVDRYEEEAIEDLEKCWHEQNKWFPSAFNKSA